MIHPRKYYVRTETQEGGGGRPELPYRHLPYSGHIRIVVHVSTYCKSSNEEISVNAEDSESVKGDTIPNLRNGPTSLRGKA